jgi:hypothetical protein
MVCLRIISVATQHKGDTDDDDDNDDHNDDDDNNNNNNNKVNHVQTMYIRKEGIDQTILNRDIIQR